MEVPVAWLDVSVFFRFRQIERHGVRPFGCNAPAMASQRTHERTKADCVSSAPPNPRSNLPETGRWLVLWRSISDAPPVPVHESWDEKLCARAPMKQISNVK